MALCFNEVKFSNTPLNLYFFSLWILGISVIQIYSCFSKIATAFKHTSGLRIIDAIKSSSAENNEPTTAIMTFWVGEICVNVEKDDIAKLILVCIRDTGVGIDPEILSRLFTKFATKSFKGTGLGLYISKSIVEAHGGRIWAENNSDGNGASFSFTLPLSTKTNWDIWLIINEWKKERILIVLWRNLYTDLTYLLGTKMERHFFLRVAPLAGLNNTCRPIRVGWRYYIVIEII